MYLILLSLKKKTLSNIAITEKNRYHIFLSLRKEKECQILVSLRIKQYQLLLSLRKKSVSNIAITDKKKTTLNVAITEKKRYQILLSMREKKNSAKYCFQ